MKIQIQYKHNFHTHVVTVSLEEILTYFLHDLILSIYKVECIQENIEDRHYGETHITVLQSTRITQSDPI